jgi:hypothetical protein
MRYFDYLYQRQSERGISSLQNSIRNKSEINEKCLQIRGGRAKRATEDDGPATTSAGAGESGLSPRMFASKKRRGPDTYAADREQLRFDKRLRNVGDSDLAAPQAEEAALGLGGDSPPPPPPPPPPDEPTLRRRTK